MLLIITWCHILLDSMRNMEGVIRNRDYASTWVSTRVFGGVRVPHIFSSLCCVVFCFFFCLFFYRILFVMCIVCLMLPVSLDCPFMIGTLAFSNVFFLSKIRTELHKPC